MVGREGGRERKREGDFKAGLKVTIFFLYDCHRNQSYPCK